MLKESQKFKYPDFNKYLLVVSLLSELKIEQANHLFFIFNGADQLNALQLLLTFTLQHLTVKHLDLYTSKL